MHKGFADLSLTTWVRRQRTCSHHYNHTGTRDAWRIPMKVTYISHACLLIDTGKTLMATDPWFDGPAFCNQWNVFPRPVHPAAAEGASLEELVKLGEKVVAGVRTMGVAISGCTPPGKDKPIFELADGEMEMGVGIHGEKGRRRAKLPNADAVVDEMFDAVSQDIPYNRGDEVALMINGLGGTPPSELYLLYRRAAIRCRDAGYSVVRNYVGNYCTSLEMAGFSLTLLKLDDELKHRLDAPAEIPFRIF